MIISKISGGDGFCKRFFGRSAETKIKVEKVIAKGKHLDEKTLRTFIILLQLYRGRPPSE